MLAQNEGFPKGEHWLRFSGSKCAEYPANLGLYLVYLLFNIQRKSGIVADRHTEVTEMLLLFNCTANIREISLVR